MQPPFELEQGHRWFAITMNNRAWDLLEQASRTPAENEEMLLAAHAAAYHWGQVGTHLNRLKAEYLLALVHAQLGSMESARRHAGRAMALAEEEITPAFDLAFTMAAAYQACRLSGDAEPAMRLAAAARKACGELSDEERSAVEPWLRL